MMKNGHVANWLNHSYLSNHKTQIQISMWLICQDGDFFMLSAERTNPKVQHCSKVLGNHTIAELEIAQMELFADGCASKMSQVNVTDGLSILTLLKLLITPDMVSPRKCNKVHSAQLLYRPQIGSVGIEQRTNVTKQVSAIGMGQSAIIL